ncbi:MAG: DeoR/GlpR family DNA-binding transcription regulator [Treponema sp.]|nr:DeoR/GlpR family DNA-binding transcription regulator [Treponema sp.]
MIIDREKYIIEQIQKTGKVQVDSLAKDLDVSSMTIRRDLETLKKKGLVDRCYGGAIIKSEIPYFDKQIANAEAKKKIAEYAISLIKPNDTVFLDAGTTTYQIARLITQIANITVITDDIQIAHFLINTPITVYMCGGLLQKSTGCVIGNFTTDMVKNFCLDIAFIGAGAIDSNFNHLTPTPEKIALKQQITSICTKTYLVADSDKFHRKALLKINGCEVYNGIITDMTFSDEEKEIIKQRNINILQVC